MPDTADDTSPTSSDDERGPSTSTGSTTTSTTGGSTTSTTGAGSGEVLVTAVAGNLGSVESAPPFTQTDPFSEAVRLSDGTCVGWADSRGGSTAGLQVGAPAIILDVAANTEIGRGVVERSRAEDVSGGAGQWNCFFDVNATLTGAPPPEFRVKIAGLDPWLAKPDPSAPTTYVASVSTDAAIGLIPSCPAVPVTPDTSATIVPTVPTVPTTVSSQLASGWSAVGQYWSRGVTSLCDVGLPVVAIARPCRPPGVGSEYIAEVRGFADPTVSYANGAPIPVGTQLAVVVATGRLCG